MLIGRRPSLDLETLRDLRKGDVYLHFRSSFHLFNASFKVDLVSVLSLKRDYVSIIQRNTKKLYGPPAYDAGNGFTSAQCSSDHLYFMDFFYVFLISTALMNLIETALNISYLYLAHISHWPAASLIGFASAIMTLSKTILYWVQEYYCNYCAVGHNKLQDLLVFWVFPNGYAYVICGLSSDLL